MQGRIFADIKAGIRPATPHPGCDPESQEIWDLLGQCWESEPSRRPSAQKLLAVLQLMPDEAQSKKVDVERGLDIAASMSKDNETKQPWPTASASTATPALASTTTRWARFHVPYDIFLDPADPVRHQLYHQIRREDWFINQTLERSITREEASRIPGLIPGESVLLAFYDRVPDSQNKAVMRCTTCTRTYQDVHVYPRPDRARVHMRHHFELRPVPCRGQCGLPHWCVT